MLIFQYCIFNNHLYNQRLLYIWNNRTGEPCAQPALLPSAGLSQQPSAARNMFPGGNGLRSCSGLLRPGQVFLKNLGHPPFGESMVIFLLNLFVPRKQIRENLGELINDRIWIRELVQNYIMTHDCIKKSDDTFACDIEFSLLCIVFPPEYLTPSSKMIKTYY